MGITDKLLRRQITLQARPHQNRIQWHLTKIYWCAIKTLDNGDKITVRGKEGNSHDVEIVTKETTTAWHRDQSGQETMDIYSSNNLHVVAVENADCSGTLTAEWIDGTNVHAEWQYIDENKTSVTFVSTSSEQPTLNYSLSW